MQFGVWPSIPPSPERRVGREKQLFITDPSSIRTQDPRLLERAGEAGVVLPGPGPTRGAGPARPGLGGRGPEAPGRSGGRVSSKLGARGSQISSLHPPGEVGPSALGCNAAKTKLKAEPPSLDRWGEGAPGSRGGRAGEPGYLVPLSSLRGPGTRGGGQRSAPRSRKRRP